MSRADRCKGLVAGGWIPLAVVRGAGDACELGVRTAHPGPRT